MLGCFGCEAGEAGCEPGLRGDGDFGAAGVDGVEDARGGVSGGDGEAGGGGGEFEPVLFFFYGAVIFGVDLAAGAHESGADGGDANALLAEFGVEALGEADESEFTGGVGEEMGHGEFAADAGDVDDGGVAEVFGTGEEVGQGGVGGVEGSEEIDGHGAVVGGEGLVFDGADFDDAGVVDEDVDAAEVGDGVVDEVGGLAGVGEVGGDEEDVVWGADGVALEERAAGAREFLLVAGREDEAGTGAGVTLGEGQAEAAGAAGDDDDLIATDGARDERVGYGSDG